MSDAKYNVVIVGKTGVGKSSLINYLFKTDQAKTGTGKPVTAEGFHKHEFQIDSLPVTIFDSWGLEADKADRWLQTLEIELAKRGTDKGPGDWFHTVLYCISAGGHRVEPYDCKIINQFLERKYKVTVLLTKADQASTDDLLSMEKTIIEEAVGQPAIIRTCSEEKELLGGIRTKAFGREEVFRQISNDFWEGICLRLPERCTGLLQKIIQDWLAEQRAALDKANVFTAKKTQRQVAVAADSFVSGLDKQIEETVYQEIKLTFSMYRRFGEILQGLANEKVSFWQRKSFSFPRDDNFIDLILTLISPLHRIIREFTALKRSRQALDCFGQEMLAEVKRIEPLIAKQLKELQAKLT